ncbi:MAG: hypothetical protein JXA93_04255 [Anaerolineae bacterium]|nr:hypothetical protein [Anaerolineae bacterium]
MGILEETRFVERLQFFNGQRLFADDLQGIEAFNREMRWLHNRSLHQPGIGSGFAVRGDRGDREVWIGPGYAIDARGREIVLTQPLTLQVPPVASDEDGRPALYDLAIAYPDDEFLEEAEARGGVCGTQGVIRREEAPVFCWVRLRRGDRDQLSAEDDELRQAVEDGMLITLARVEVLNCQLHGFVSIAARRDARPACLPYIACAVAEPTDWEVEEILETNGGSLALIHVEVETKNAGFETTPCYTAEILGSRTAVLNVDGFDETFLLVDHATIQDARPDGFIAYAIVDLVHDVAPFPGTLQEWLRKNWRLQWLGTEG